VAALAANIRMLLENEQLAQDMGAAGRLRVIETFDIRARTRELESFYDGFTSGRG
jgi:glycosyltransferase involved in cell wall biosynthesis